MPDSFLTHREQQGPVPVTSARLAYTSAVDGTRSSHADRSLGPRTPPRPLPERPRTLPRDGGRGRRLRHPGLVGGRGPRCCGRDPRCAPARRPGRRDGPGAPRGHGPGRRRGRGHGRHRGRGARGHRRGAGLRTHGWQGRPASRPRRARRHRRQQPRPARRRLGRRHHGGGPARQPGQRRLAAPPGPRVDVVRGRAGRRRRRLGPARPGGPGPHPDRLRCRGRARGHRRRHGGGPEHAGCGGPRSRPVLRLPGRRHAQHGRDGSRHPHGRDHRRSRHRPASRWRAPRPPLRRPRPGRPRDRRQGRRR